MSRARALALAATLLLAGGCAATAPSLPGEAAGAGSAVWIDLFLQTPTAPTPTPPEQVWFVRIGPLDGSPCLPRDGDAPAPPFAADDPTCARDADGHPVWKPVFLQADRIAGDRALLLDPPPARYVAVAARFRRVHKGEVTLYFTRTLIAHTEMPVPAGSARYMGRYRLSFGDWPFLGAAETFVRSRIDPEAGAGAPDAAAGLLGGLVKGKTSSGLHRSARWEELRPPAPHQKDAGPLW